MYLKVGYFSLRSFFRCHFILFGRVFCPFSSTQKFDEIRMSPLVTALEIVVVLQMIPSFRFSFLVSPQISIPRPRYSNYPVLKNLLIKFLANPKQILFLCLFLTQNHYALIMSSQVLTRERLLTLQLHIQGSPVLLKHKRVHHTVIFCFHFYSWSRKSMFSEQFPYAEHRIFFVVQFLQSKIDQCQSYMQERSDARRHRKDPHPLTDSTTYRVY